MTAEARLVAQSAAVLFALSLVNGFLVHLLPLREQLLEAHLIGLLGSLFMLVFACLWSQLNLTNGMSKAGTFCIVYGFGMGWLVNFIAAISGIFGVFPVSVSANQQRSPGDILISVGLLSVVLALFALCAILSVGLRRANQRKRIPA